MRGYTVRPSGLQPSRVLVTGATGFVGSGVVSNLIASGFRVRAALRVPAAMPSGVDSAVLGDLRRPVNLIEAFRDVDFVVHSAGLAHADAAVGEETYFEINAGITDSLARTARNAGVKCFVLLSSVRAQTGPGADGPVTEATPAQPTDAYGRSKLEAERLLAEANVPFVVLRPVLVHGPGMRLNMAELLRLARSRWPLPLGGFTAKRSIVARDHFADAVQLAISNPEMVGGTYLVADPEPLSVAEMITALRAGWGREAGLMPLPVGLVELVGRLSGRREQMVRLTQQLVVDPGKLIAAGWRPRLSAFDALAQTAAQYV